MKTRLDKPTAESFVKTFAGYVRTGRLYPPGHSTAEKLKNELNRCLKSIFTERESFIMGRCIGYLVVGDIMFLTDNPAAEQILNWLNEKDKEGAIVEPEVGIDELCRFSHWLSSHGDDDWAGENISMVSIEIASAMDLAAAAHGNAVDSLSTMYEKVEEGGIPDIVEIRNCTNELSGFIDKDPGSVGALMLIKNYDNYTFHHSVNVCTLSLALGRQMGLGASELKWLSEGAILHDIGKIRTPVDLVRKPGPLSKNEWKIMSLHPTLGGEIVGMIDGLDQAVRKMVFEHHMREDGGGYPAMPPGYKKAHLSSIIAVADIYDAATSHRSYSIPYPLPEAVRIIKKLAGKHINPEAAKAFVKTMGDIPIGSIARLSSGEVVVVADADETGEEQLAKIVIEANGTRRKMDDCPACRFRPEEVVRWGTSLKYGIDAVEVLKCRKPDN